MFGRKRKIQIENKEKEIKKIKESHNNKDNKDKDKSNNEDIKKDNICDDINLKKKGRKPTFKPMESNLLKELWTPNLYRILLQEDSHKMTNIDENIEFDELRFSEIGFPVWSEEWFEYPTNKNKNTKISSRGHLKRPTKRKVSTRNGAITSTNIEDEMTNSWLDPHVLITPQTYGNVSESVSVLGSMDQPFQVIVHPQVPLLCDLHSHLCDAEIIGFLAGKYNRETKILYIQACFPCNSLERIDDGSTDVEMDPIAELSVREVITKYDLEVVGWYHSHPLFCPDPSTTDIRNQYQYQQLFRHNDNPSEPFVGLIVSTCDPNLPNYESLHQWFHVVPFTNKPQTSNSNEEDINVKRTRPTRGRKNTINNTNSSNNSIKTNTKHDNHNNNHNHHDCHLDNIYSQPMYLPMKIEISIANLKSTHDLNKLIISPIPFQISQALENELLNITKEQIGEYDKTLFEYDHSSSSSSCSNILNQVSSSSYQLSHHINSDDIQLVQEVEMKENENDKNENENVNEKNIILKVDEEYLDIHNELSPSSPLLSSTVSNEVIDISNISPTSSINTFSFQLISESKIDQIDNNSNNSDSNNNNNVFQVNDLNLNIVEVEEKDSENKNVTNITDVTDVTNQSNSDIKIDLIVDNLTSSSSTTSTTLTLVKELEEDSIRVEVKRKGRKKGVKNFRPQDNIIPLRKSERRSCAVKDTLSKDFLVINPIKKKRTKQLNDKILIDNSTINVTNYDINSNATTFVIDNEELNGDTKTSSNENNDNKIFQENNKIIKVRTKPGRKKKNSRKSKLNLQPNNDDGIKSSKNYSELTSISLRSSLSSLTTSSTTTTTTTKAAVTRMLKKRLIKTITSKTIGDSNTFPSLPLHFYLYFQQTNSQYFSQNTPPTSLLTFTSSSSIARYIICKSSILLRYISLCTIALGYYYCQYNKRTNILKKYKVESKYIKIKYSLLVWLHYFGMESNDENTYLNELIRFLLLCWEGR